MAERKTRGARLCGSAAPLPRDQRHPRTTGPAPDGARPPRLVHRRGCARFQPRSGSPAQGAGIKTVHFICPSIWAWRPKRVEKIQRSTDHVLCIFPFEPALLARHGIASTYVGHPIANVIPLQPDKAAARRALGLRDDTTRWSRSCRAAGLRRCSTWPNRFLLRLCLMRRARPRPALRGAGGACPGRAHPHIRRGQRAG